MKMRSTVGVALLTFICIVVPPSAWAWLAPPNGIGGDGGAPFRTDCGGYGVLVGIIGHSGVVIDQLGGLCVKIDPVSGVWVGGVYETPRFGGSGGGQFRKICPVGNALSGIEGNINNFDGTPVVGSIEIRCMELGIEKERNGARISGTRVVDYYGDPDPYKVKEAQDYCYSQRGPKMKEPRVWENIALGLEGRSGNFLDRIHVVCGSLAQDTRGYRVDFRKSAQSAVPEGMPLQISWRASGTRPELTPPLQYSWQLYDLTHPSEQCSVIGCLPDITRIRTACEYALQPCANSWDDSSSGSSVIFNALPAAVYRLTLSVRPQGPRGSGSYASLQFEIVPNMLAALTLDPSTIRPGGGTTATIALQGPASTRGVTVYLSSSNQQLLSTPPSIVIPAGRPSASLTLRPDSRVLGGQVTVTASLRKPLSLSAAQATSQVQGFGAQGAQSVNSAGATAQVGPRTANPPVVTRGIGDNAPVSTLSQSNQVVRQIVNGPGDTKSAVLNIHPNLALKSLTVPNRQLQIGK